MNESVHSFGTRTKLVGVLTQADGGLNREDGPVVLMLNAGLLSRTGPFRLHVILARSLANIGVSSFRFDLSGIGDSERRKDNRPRDEQHIEDINDAVQFLSETADFRKFLLMGICTGADLAHKALLRNSRIGGAICIDGYAYPTPRYYFNRYVPKMGSLLSWKNLAARLSGLNRKTSDKSHADAAVDTLDYRWVLPPKAAVRRDYEDLIARDVRLLCVYTSAWPYNYDRQLIDAFPSLNFGHAIRSAFLKNATHTFKTNRDRDILVRTIIDWLNDPQISTQLESAQPGE